LGGMRRNKGQEVSRQKREGLTPEKGKENSCLDRVHSIEGAAQRILSGLSFAMNPKGEIEHQGAMPTTVSTRKEIQAHLNDLLKKMTEVRGKAGN